MPLKTKTFTSRVAVKNFFPEEPDKTVLVVAPIPAAIALALTVPTEGLTLSAVRMDEYEKEALDVVRRYGEALADELEKLVVQIKKLKKKEVVVPPDDLEKMLKTAEDRMNRMLKPFEKDVGSAVTEELKKDARKYKVLAEAVIRVDVSLPKTGVSIKARPEMSAVPKAAGTEKILLAKKNLWKETREEPSGQYLKPPKFFAEIHYSVDRGVYDIFERQKKLHDGLRKDMIDATDRRVIPLAKALTDAFETLDEKAKSGGIEYRIHFKKWSAECKKRLADFKKDLPADLEKVWDRFVQNNKLFLGKKIAVSLDVILGEIQGSPARPKPGVLTPLAIAKEAAGFAAAWKRPKNVEKQIRIYQADHEALIKMIRERIDRTDDKNKPDDKNKKDSKQSTGPAEMDSAEKNQWSRMIRAFGVKASVVQKSVKELAEMLEDVAEAVKEIQSAVTDKAQVQRYKQLEKFIKTYVGDFKSFQGSLKTCEDFHELAEKTYEALVSKDPKWAPDEKTLKSVDLCKPASDLIKKAEELRGEAFKIVDIKTG